MSFTHKVYPLPLALSLFSITINMSTTSFYRIFDQNGNKLSTAVLNHGDFLQIKPSRQRFNSQMNWINSVTNNGQTLFTISCELKARTKPWAEMTEAERKEHMNKLHKAALERKNKKNDAIRVKRQAESPFTKAVRALYDEYYLSDSIAITKPYKKVGNPKLHILTNEGNICPVFFNRKSGNVLTSNGITNRVIEESNVSAPYNFFIQRSWGMEKAILPIQDTRKPAPGQKVIGLMLHHSDYKNSEFKKKMSSVFEAEGYLVKSFKYIDHWKEVKEIEINYPEIDFIVTPSYYTGESATIYNTRKLINNPIAWLAKRIPIANWVDHIRGKN
jgi:hypothetical protein